MTEAQELRDKAAEQAAKRRKALSKQWKDIAATHPAVIADLNAYVDGLRNIYLISAEEREMGGVPLDDHQIASLLQLSKGCNIVRTYITSLIDQDVAQPIKKSK